MLILNYEQLDAQDERTYLSEIGAYIYYNMHTPQGLLRVNPGVQLPPSDVLGQSQISASQCI
jgi:hypothetical protein